MSLAKKVLESYGVAEALEIWQMTKYEYEEKFGKPKNNTTVTGGFHPHKEAVETALNQGKKVPSVVLRDYPELSNNEYASKKDSDYIKKSKEKEVIQKVEAFNNVMVKKVEGTNLVTNYVTGTRFALDGVEKMLKEEGIPFSKTKAGIIQITFNKDVNESLTVPMKFEIAMEKLAKKPVKVRLETMEYALKNMMERATEKTGNNMMIKEFSAHLLSVVQHGFKDIVDDDENDDTMEDDISEDANLQHKVMKLRDLFGRMSYVMNKQIKYYHGDKVSDNLKKYAPTFKDKWDVLADIFADEFSKEGELSENGKSKLKEVIDLFIDFSSFVYDNLDDVKSFIKKQSVKANDDFHETFSDIFTLLKIKGKFQLDKVKEQLSESDKVEFIPYSFKNDLDKICDNLAKAESISYYLVDRSEGNNDLLFKKVKPLQNILHKLVKDYDDLKKLLKKDESLSESKKFTVKMLREEVNTVEELKEAMKFYLDNATKMTLGEATAFRSTIRTVGEKLGLKVKDLNDIFNELQSNESLAVKVLEAHK